METGTVNVTSTEGAKKSHKRSANYPSLTVAEAYSFSQKINEKFGANVEFTREEIAHAMGQHPNTLARPLAACAQFSFVDKNEGKYKLSKLFLDIFRPESEKEKSLNLIKAFGNPKLYQDLIQKFDGNIVPLELTNTLIKHHGITEAASNDAADTFITSAKEVGVLNDNRALRYSVTISTLHKTQYAEIIDAVDEAQDNGNYDGVGNQKPPVILDVARYTPSGEDRKIPIHLTKNKMAYFIYPPDITSNDIKIVEYEVKGILLRLELEKEDEKRE